MSEIVLDHFLADFELIDWRNHRHHHQLWVVDDVVVLLRTEISFAVEYLYVLFA